VKAEGPRGREVATSHPAPVAIPTGRWLSRATYWITGRPVLVSWARRSSNKEWEHPTAQQTQPHTTQQQLERSRSLGVDTCASRSLRVLGNRDLRDCIGIHQQAPFGESRIVPASLRHGLLDWQNKMAGREAQQAQAAAKEFLFKVLVVGGTTPPRLLHLSSYSPVLISLQTWQRARLPSSGVASKVPSPITTRPPLASVRAYPSSSPYAPSL
jgi:hypothetical protein